jgi:hypothetical protein
LEAEADLEAEAARRAALAADLEAEAAIPAAREAPRAAARLAVLARLADRILRERERDCFRRSVLLIYIYIKYNFFSKLLNLYN